MSEVEAVGRVRREGRRPRRRAAQQGRASCSTSTSSPTRPTSRSSSPSPGRPPSGPPGCARSTSSCWARCGCWPATSSRWPPARARRCRARSPPPAMRSAGRSVHVITINDYLARRDAEWMGPLIEAMGLTVGWITEDSTAEERRAAYQCDVTYASVNEIGFDVLRDQLVTDVADLVSPEPGRRADRRGRLGAGRRGAGAAGAGRHDAPRDPRLEIVRLVGELHAGVDYDTDTDSRNVHLTEAGAQKLEKALGGIDLYSEEHVGTTLTEVNVALHAHVLLQRDVHYIVRDGAVQSDQLLARPDRAAAALARRAAGGRRGQGGHRDHRDRRGARHHHRAGADQPLPDGVRHDRHRAGRRRAAAPVLQARRLADPAEHAEHPRGRGRPGVHHRGGQERRRSSSTSPTCTPAVSRCWSAPTTSPNPRSCTSGWSSAACPRSC